MATPLSGMYGEGLPAYFTAKSMFMGYLPGCIGEISAFALLLGGAYLIWRNVISWRIPVSFIGTVALLTLVFGKSGYSNGQWMLYNLFSGSLMLGAIFMATDYVTSPITHKGKVVYGILLGIITGLFRLIASSTAAPEGVSYAIIFCNLLVPMIDNYTMPIAFGWKGVKDEENS